MCDTTFGSDKNKYLSATGFQYITVVILSQGN